MTEAEVLALIKSTLLSVQIKLATKAAALWPAGKVLLAGQLGHEEDTGLTKIGNGYTQWSLLGYLKVNGADVIQSTLYRLVSDAEKVLWNAMQPVSEKDASGGYVGKTLQKINFRNAANTFTSFFANANTAVRTYNYPDKDITVAGLDDLTNFQIILNYTSASSKVIGSGSKVFTVQAGLDLIVGRFYRAFSASAPNNWMEGKCTAYTGTSFTLNVNFISGSGTYADWKIENARGKVVLRPTASYTSVTTSLNPVPGLSVILLSGETYELNFYGLYSSNTDTNGAGISINYAGTPDILSGNFTAAVNAASPTSTELSRTIRDGLAYFTSSGVAPIDTNHYIGFRAVIKFPSDTTVQILFSAEVAGNSSTLDILSSLVINRIS